MAEPRILKRRERQEYLTDLGLYTGPINGEWTKETRLAVDKLQKKYFPKKYQDGGLYTKRHTDILLVNAWRVWKYAPHFDLTEFRCNCDGKYCTGYPAYLNIQLLKNLEKTRCYFDKPMTITSGLRCEKYNSVIDGSVANSGHLNGTASDFFLPGITTTIKGRKKVMAYWKTLPKYYYTYAYIPGSTDKRMSSCKNMGNCTHGEVSSK